MDHMPMKELGERILKLSGAIGKLSGLITFSFTIDADTRDKSWCGCYVPIFARGPLTQLLLALPPSCVNLELDTDGTERTGSEYLPWNHDNETDPDDREQMGIEKDDNLACDNNGSNDNEVPTLCKANYKVLPQLEHLRLRCGMLCPNIIGLTHALRVNAPPATLTQDFPNLKTFVLNQMTRNMHPVGTELCGLYIMGTRAWDTYWPRASYELAGALSHCRRFLPSLTKCQIISSRPLNHRSPANTAAETALQPWRQRLRDGPCEHKQIYHIRSYDVLENRTVVMPFEPIKQNLSELWYSLCPPLWQWNLFRNQDQEVSIGSLRQVESAVEDAWYSTTTGLRFTKDFKKSSADEEMIWVAVGGGTQAQYESFDWDRRYWNRLPEAPGTWEDVGDTSGFDQSLSREAPLEYSEDDADAQGAGLSAYQEALKREVEFFDGYAGQSTGSSPCHQARVCNKELIWTKGSHLLDVVMCPVNVACNGSCAAGTWDFATHLVK